MFGRNSKKRERVLCADCGGDEFSVTAILFTANPPGALSNPGKMSGYVDGEMEHISPLYRMTCVSCGSADKSLTKKEAEAA